MADWIYVVDGDKSNLRMAGRILSKNGMRVSAFTSGQGMLEGLKNGSPDLILPDIMMPGLNGFDTLSKLHRSVNSKKRKRSLGFAIKSS